jgi:hypothetical protein
LAIVNFLKHIRSNANFTKESLRTAMVWRSSPQETLNIFTISPMKSDRQQSAPPTPSKEFLGQKLKELKILKTQLENEKFEKSMLDVEFQQSQEKIENLGKNP